MRADVSSKTSDVGLRRSLTTPGTADKLARLVEFHSTTATVMEPAPYVRNR